MNVYEYSPPKSNKKASGIILILFSLAAGLFLFTLLFPNIPFKWAIQLISIVAFVAVIFIISRYVAKSFVYAIAEADDGTLDLTVSNIEEAYLLDRSNPEHIEKIKSLQKSAKADGRKSFNYCPDINPTEFCIILVEECGEKFMLKTSPNSTLCKYLRAK